MELIERYLQAVGVNLPAARRADIERELRANIMDQVDALGAQLGRALSASEQAELLIQLGHPQLVAQRFLPPQQLVSDNLLGFYKQVLYYSLLIVLCIESIKFGMGFLSSGHIALGEFIGGLINTTPFIFTLVTAIFYFLSNTPAAKGVFNPYANWHPEKLPKIQLNWQRINPFDQAMEFSSTVFLFLLLNLLIALMLLAISRLEEIITYPNGTGSDFFTAATNNSHLANVLIFTSCWLLFEFGRDIYRYWKLKT
jgi:hypothetical protein